MGAKYRHGQVLSLDYTPSAAVDAGTVLNVHGRVCIAQTDLEANILGAVAAPVGENVWEFPKAANVVILDGGRVFYDPSTDECSFKKATAHAFYVGTAVGDSASTDTTLQACVNGQQSVLIGLARDAFQSVIVKTAGVPLLRRLGGAHSLELDATNEAQKVDALSDDSFNPTDGFIAEFEINAVTNGTTNAVDLNVGLASGTHASDADSITKYLFVHVDGNSTAINLQSKDGTTTVAATDTTKTLTAGTTFHVWVDGRDPSDCQVYINGVLVLPDSVFSLAAMTTAYLLAHLEKSAATATGEIHVNRAEVRLAV